MLADIKEPHLDFLGDPNSLSHGSDHMHAVTTKTSVVELDLTPCIKRDVKRMSF